jgi:hypothetical protein
MSSEIKGNVTLSSETAGTNIGGWIDSGYNLAKLKETAAIAANSSNMAFWDNTESLQYALIISNSTGSYNYALLDLKNFTVIPNTNYRITISCWTNVTDMSFSFDYPQNTSLYKTLASTTLTTYTFTITATSNTSGFFSLVLRTDSNTAVASGSKYLYVGSIKIEKPAVTISNSTICMNGSLKSHLNMSDNYNTSTYKIRLANDDVHYIYSTGTTGDKTFFGEYGTGSLNLWHFFNTNASVNATVATINANGVYASLSDRNKKKDFESSTLGLNEILQLKPTLYRYITQEEGEKSLGFIAQEVQPIIPQAYSENDELIGLNYNVFIPVLVKAVQEMKLEYETKFQEYETKYETLVSRYETLVSRYETLFSKIQEIKTDYDAKLSKLEERLLMVSPIKNGM